MSAASLSAAIPEPATVALLLLAAASLLVRARHRAAAKNRC
jgi:hypothetical protein